MRDDVLIVGAGPTGLALALWLTKQGIRVRILDKNAGPGTASRAMAVQARTLELYRQLDIADAVVAAGYTNFRINMWVGGKEKAHISFNDAGAGMTPYPFILVYPQDRHERLLADRLRELGVIVERNTEFVDFTQEGDCIVARLRDAAGDESEIEALYLAGCDGAKSMVRHRIGSNYPGGTYDKMFYVADVQLKGAAANGETHLALDKADFMACLAYDATGKARLIGIIGALDEEEGKKLTFEDVAHTAIANMQLEIENVSWFSTYRVHHRVTDHYRHGRAFLVGDAAHVHSPAGGQGMNTGIGDAINLAWKLAAVIRNEAPDSLLDSYEAERRAFAVKLVDTTDRIFSFVTSNGHFADFVRTRIAPVFIPAAYHFEGVREFMFRLVSQIQISYGGCALNEGKAGQVHGGDRLPWVRFGDVDNYDSLSRIGWQVHVYGDAPGDLAPWCDERGIALHVFAWSAEYGKAGLERDAAYLLRPDTYVAFAEKHASTEAIGQYLADRQIKLASAGRKAASIK